jgi:hypothetical protein
MGFSTDSNAASADIDALLRALELQAGEMAAATAAAQRGVNQHTFEPYHALQQKTFEHESLVAVIENRLDRLGRDCPPKLRDRLDTFERSALAERIRGSFKVLFALSAIPLLPFGVRELFNGELKALHAARGKLRDPKHQGRCDPELQQDLETAELILTEVMEKAPGLLDFTGQDGETTDDPAAGKPSAAATTGGAGSE